jgi:hypothetical protein
MIPENLTKLIQSRHYDYISNMADWEKYRLTYRGGEEYRRRYLKKFSAREDDADFSMRASMTPIPTFAKAAVKDIRNAIYQRLRDIVRVNGTKSYMEATTGDRDGVDLLGSTMNSFLGKDCLDDLLVMGAVGVYVDNPIMNTTPTKASLNGSHPYLYMYRRENILSWTFSERADDFRTLLLRDTTADIDPITGFAISDVNRYRHYEVIDGRVRVQFYSDKGMPIDQFGNPSGPQFLELKRIPFVMFDIGDSLLTDVAEYQIALLNLGSSDINYAWRSNFPFYVEQRDSRNVGSHLKTASSDGTAATGGQGSDDREINVGPVHGRYYDKDTNVPQYIAPPTAPLEVSMKLQDKLEQDIRKLVNLAVTTLATRSSAESKQMDNQGLESGLSFIGETLQKGERQIAYHWGQYERATSTALITYPTSYSLKSDRDRIAEADELGKFMSKVPGRTIKRELSKAMVDALLSGRVSHETLLSIHQEIDKAEFTTSDVDSIIRAKEAGLVGDRVASIALGFADSEYLQAKTDHIDRLARIAEAQTPQEVRGVPDTSANPNAGRDEKADQRNTDTKETTKAPVRGPGKRVE